MSGREEGGKMGFSRSATGFTHDVDRYYTDAKLTARPAIKTALATLATYIGPITGERLLIGGIIDNALRDLRHKDERRRIAAQAWINEGRGWFVEYCGLIGVDPDYIRRLSKQIKPVLHGRTHKPKV